MFDSFHHFVEHLAFEELVVGVVAETMAEIGFMLACFYFVNTSTSNPIAFNLSMQYCCNGRGLHPGRFTSINDALPSFKAIKSGKPGIEHNPIFTTM